MNIIYNGFKIAKQVGKQRREEALTDHWCSGEERQEAGSTRRPSSACRHRLWGGKELWSLGTFCSSDLQGELLSQQKQNPQSYPGDW